MNLVKDGYRMAVDGAIACPRISLKMWCEC